MRQAQREIVQVAAKQRPPSRLPYRRRRAAAGCAARVSQSGGFAHRIDGRDHGGPASWVPFLNVILWLAAGYFAVYLYRRRTGVLLNVRSGVRIGWITGLLVYAIVAVFFGGFLVLFNMSGGAEIFQAQLRNSADPRMVEALKTCRTVRMCSCSSMQLFVFITLFEHGRRRARSQADRRRSAAAHAHRRVIRERARAAGRIA